MLLSLSRRAHPHIHVHVRVHVHIHEAETEYYEEEYEELVPVERVVEETIYERIEVQVLQ